MYVCVYIYIDLSSWDPLYNLSSSLLLIYEDKNMLYSVIIEPLILYECETWSLH